MLLICQGSQLLPHLLPHPLPPWWPPPHPLSRSLQPLTHLVRHSEVCGIVCNTVKSPTAPLHVSKSCSFNSWRLASPYLSLLQHCWVEHPTSAFPHVECSLQTCTIESSCSVYMHTCAQCTSLSSHCNLTWHVAQQRRSVRKRGGGAGAANSSQFKVVDVANSVTRRASLMVMCLFTGFFRHGHHKITNLTLSITVSNPCGYLWK